MSLRSFLIVVVVFLVLAAAAAVMHRGGDHGMHMTRMLHGSR